MKTLILLHGAIGASDQLLLLKEKLDKDFDIHLLNFSGHGGKPFSDGDFSIANFSQEVVEYINVNKLDDVAVFGYSMGGYVGTYIARHYPGMINKLATLATKFYWDETIAAKETGMLNAEKIETKVPVFADALSKRHQPNDWKLVLRKTGDMLLAMGKDNPLKLEDYPNIELPVLLMIGDRDKMVTLEETLAVYKQLPNAQMGMLPNSNHPIEQTDIDSLAFHLSKFMK